MAVVYCLLIYQVLGCDIVSMNKRSDKINFSYCSLLSSQLHVLHMDLIVPEFAESYLTDFLLWNPVSKLQI